ncbi:MAG TPA: SDR family oxidoreductase [Nostocaceae cyanobacterium]|nr:SDR family oxidoreductase [Nostocaceae cyanobacterium]
MNKTVLITGASSGIGKAAAQLFAEKGWIVVATARNLDSIEDLKSLPNVTTLQLDVTDSLMIKESLSKALEEVEKIDVLVNNAGYGLFGPFEAINSEQIQRQFTTNVFGLFEVTRTLLPHFRDRHSGIIINIASMGGRVAFPLTSLYHATKWAIEGFSESLQYELEPFGIRVKIIEPGVIRTGFYDRLDLPPDTGISEYDQAMQTYLKIANKSAQTGASADVVAKVIYRAATDNSNRLRYAAAAPILAVRKLLPDNIFFALIRRLTR